MEVSLCIVIRDPRRSWILDSRLWISGFWIPTVSRIPDFLLVERGFRILKPKVVYLSQKLLENPVGK